MNCPRSSTSRRDFLRRGVAASVGVLTLPAFLRGADEKPPPLAARDRRDQAPTSPVAIARCREFHLEKLAGVLAKAFDQLGGVRKLVSGKTVTVKLNTTGHGRQKLGGKPAERTYQVHPNMIEVLVGLLNKAGARRIYLVESFYEDKPPEEILAAQGWDIQRIHSAADHKTSFEDTRHRGGFKDYVKLAVPWGGFTFPAYHLNRRYEETDVLVSVAKVKEHVTAGVTGAVKNLFGIAPTSLYGNDAPNERTTQNRGNVLHHATRRVPAGVTQELHPEREPLPSPRESYYRVPMVTADLLGVRPIDLSIVDGIETCKGGEGPWCRGTRPVAPGIVLAGRNAVTVDAVMTAAMGFDPLTSTGEKPWYGYNHLELLARAGVGTNDPGRIEVIGLPLKEALFRYPTGVRGWLDKQS
ncbi:MAG: DUF362 domain-containing protein [Planctomycetota bacterium]|nr:DUF362 domain-containing protein [Planctomycetota bacterium]